MNNGAVIISKSAPEPAKHPLGIVAWLETFAEKVRIVDYAGAEKMFSKQTFGFGTKADAYHSLDEWHHAQWSHVWPKTNGFQFDLMTLSTILSADGSLCCVTCEWQSSGKHEDGSLFPRHGRSTILLVPATADPDTKWLGVHSHFSMASG